MVLLLSIVFTPQLVSAQKHKAVKKATRFYLQSPELQIDQKLSWPKDVFFKIDTISLVFAGDIMLHQGQIDNARKSGGEFDFSTFLEAMQGIYSSADLSIANMEFTLAGKPYTGYPAFSAPDSYADYVADCGVDVFLTANNHILDKGKAGLIRTLKIYDEMNKERNIVYTGTSLNSSDDIASYPLMVNINDLSIALINFTYGTNTTISDGFPKVNLTSKAEILSAIKRSKEKGADYIIALPHWGIEYQLIHSKSQEDLAKWLIDNGVNLIVGAHPHVVQDAEYIDGVPVIYSMGNVVSNMSAPNTQVGLTVNIKFTKDSFGKKQMLKPEYIMTWCTRPGSLCDSYKTIPIKEYIGKRNLWINPKDYDNMKKSYERVKTTTGIIDL